MCAKRLLRGERPASLVDGGGVEFAELLAARDKAFEGMSRVSDLNLGSLHGSLRCKDLSEERSALLGPLFCVIGSLIGEGGHGLQGDGLKSQRGLHVDKALLWLCEGLRVH